MNSEKNNRDIDSPNYRQRKKYRHREKVMK